MTHSDENIRSILTKYLTEEFFSDEPEILEGQTALLSEGFIDSLSVMVLVEFIEQQFGFEFEPHEVDADNLDSVARMVGFIQAKLAKAGKLDEHAAGT